MGWLMTHIPSGYCVVNSPFDSKEVAMGFAQNMGLVYSDKLSDPTGSFIWLTDTESRKQMRLVIETIATEKPLIIAGHYIDRLMQ